MVKRNCGTPQHNLQPTSEASYKKKNLWIMTKGNNPHNIGIKPYMDYMGTFQSYPRITDYQDTSTHERVTRVHT